MDSSKQNFISIDGKTARSSYGDFFSIGEVVAHQDSEVGEATITSFTGDKAKNEIIVDTTKGFAHLDFLVKLENAELQRV